jgi:hypothetical protein
VAPLSWLLPFNVMATSFVLLAMAALWRSHGYLARFAGCGYGDLARLYRLRAATRVEHDDLPDCRSWPVDMPHSHRTASQSSPT